MGTIVSVNVISKDVCDLSVEVTFCVVEIVKIGVSMLEEKTWLEVNTGVVS